MSVRANAEIFRQVPLFADCERAHLQVLAFSSRRREFAAGETILRQAENGKCDDDLDQSKAGTALLIGPGGSTPRDH